MSKKYKVPSPTKRPKSPAWIYETYGTDSKSLKESEKRIATHEKQRARQGFSRFDWWGFDTYVAGLIADGVEDFRKNRRPAPAGMTDKEWKKLLKAIEQPLRRYANHEDDSYKSAQQALKLFAEYLSYMWD